jgi:hypothetical protein
VNLLLEAWSARIVDAESDAEATLCSMRKSSQKALQSEYFNPALEQPVSVLRR